MNHYAIAILYPSPTIFVIYNFFDRNPSFGLDDGMKMEYNKLCICGGAQGRIINK